MWVISYKNSVCSPDGASLFFQKQGCDFKAEQQQFGSDLKNWVDKVREKFSMLPAVQKFQELARRQKQMRSELQQVEEELTELATARQGISDADELVANIEEVAALKQQRDMFTERLKAVDETAAGIKNNVIQELDRLLRQETKNKTQTLAALREDLLSRVEKAAVPFFDELAKISSLLVRLNDVTAGPVLDIHGLLHP
jgi:hypothetical protein